MLGGASAAQADMGGRRVAEWVALFSVCIIGVLAGIYFMQTFSGELKPLVLAFIFVSILEPVVQFLEFTFLKTWVLCKLLVWKVLLLLVCCKRKSIGFCCKSPSEVQDIKKGLADWAELRKRWHGRDVGKYTVFRILSVLLALLLLVLVVMLLNGLVLTQVSNVVQQGNMYRQQVMLISSCVSAQMPDLVRALPAQLQPQASEALQNIGKGFNGSNLMANLEKYGNDVLIQLVSSSSTLFMQLVFFLLYTTFLLFAPLHINLEGDAEAARARGGTPAASLWSRWLAMIPSQPAELSEPLRLGEEGRASEDSQPSAGVELSHVPEVLRLTEIQVFLYKIMWNYFLMMILLNLIFAVLVFALLAWKRVSLSVIIAGASFFLSFIPELGSIISMVLPVPFILLTPAAAPDAPEMVQMANATTCVWEDLRSDFVQRGETLLWVVGGIILIKLLVSNFLYSFFMGRNKTLAGAIKDDVEEVAETHGVVVLFAVVFFGKIWGTVGMLISVPLLSIIRLTLNIGFEREKTKRWARRQSFKVPSEA